MGVMGLSGLPAEQVRAMVAQSRKTQGLPPRVSDTWAVARIVVLLGGPAAVTRAHAPGASTRGAGGQSVAPDGVDPGGIQGAGARLSGSDDYVVDNGGEDGVLPAEIQGRPLAS